MTNTYFEKETIYFYFLTCLYGNQSLKYYPCFENMGI